MITTRTIVFLQEPTLFSTSVRDNITYGASNPAEITDQQIQQALVQAHAEGFVKQLPDGLDTVIGERGSTLSGGFGLLIWSYIPGMFLPLVHHVVIISLVDYIPEEKKLWEIESCQKTSFQVVNVNAWQSPVPWSITHRLSSSMRPPALWMQRVNSR